MKSRGEEWQNSQTDKFKQRALKNRTVTCLTTGFQMEEPEGAEGYIFGCSQTAEKVSSIATLVRRASAEPSPWANTHNVVGAQD